MQYTCDGANTFPGLRWEGIPEKTASLVLIMDDPDAPNKDWVHWVLYNIPSTITGLYEGRPLPAEILVGTNTGMSKSYIGPCPPSGRHRYYFKLFALDIDLPLEEGATKPEVIKAMEGHILDQTELMATYQRRVHS